MNKFTQWLKQVFCSPTVAPDPPVNYYQNMNALLTYIADLNARFPADHQVSGCKQQAYLAVLAALKGWEAPRMQEIRSYLASQGYFAGTYKGSVVMTNGNIRIAVSGDPYELSSDLVPKSDVRLLLEMSTRNRPALIKPLYGVPSSLAVAEVLSWYN